jgi:hypothetical protein
VVVVCEGRGCQGSLKSNRNRKVLLLTEVGRGRLDFKFQQIFLFYCRILKLLSPHLISVITLFDFDISRWSRLDIELFVGCYTDDSDLMTLAMIRVFFSSIFRYLLGVLQKKVCHMSKPTVPMAFGWRGCYAHPRQSRTTLLNHSRFGHFIILELKRTFPIKTKSL